MLSYITQLRTRASAPLNAAPQLGAADAVTPRRWADIGLSVSVLLFILLRFWEIGRHDLYAGDTFVIDGIRLSWAGMFDYIVADIVHPPLFYILARFWLLAGESVVWVRLLPVLISLTALYPLLKLGRELALPRGAVALGIYMLAVNGFVVHYAQEFRNYALLFALGSWSLWLAARWHNQRSISPRLTAALFLCNLLLVYSHYFGWVLIGCQGLALLLMRRDHFARFALVTTVVGLLFAPWLWFVARSAAAIGGLDSNLDWIPIPDLISVVNLLADFSGTLATAWADILGSLLLSAPLLLLLLETVRRRRRLDAIAVAPLLWLAMMSILPIVIIFIASQFLRQALFIDRYFLFAVPPLYFLLALSLFSLRNPTLRAGLLAAVLLWVSATASYELTTRRVAWVNPQVGSRIPWVDVVDSLRAAESPEARDVPIYTVDVASEGRWTGNWTIGRTLDYHFRQLGESRFDIVYGGPPDNFVDLLEADSHFWVAYFDLKTPWVNDAIMQVLATHGFQTGTPLRFVDGDNSLTLLPVVAADAGTED